MSGKRTVDYDKLIVSGDMSSDVVSDQTNIQNLDRVAYQISYTGTPTGVFSVQVSNDGSIWEDLTLSATISATGSADNHFIDCETAGLYLRLKYTASSGTGSLNVHISGKSI